MTNIKNREPKSQNNMHKTHKVQNETGGQRMHHEKVYNAGGKQGYVQRKNSLHDTYTSYSGCDIVATIRVPVILPDGTPSESTYTLGSLQTISISTYQEKMPVRVIGNVNAQDYTMGPRTIAGSLVFAVFDKHFADNILNDLGDSSKTVLVDELPAFDITITYANEYGSKSRTALYGVSIVEEGQVISINDVYTENTYKYCALSTERLNKSETGHSRPIDTEMVVMKANQTMNNDSNTPGRDIAQRLSPDKIDHNKESISLYVETEDARNNSNFGVARFKVSPRQKSGFIHIYDIFGEKVKNIPVNNEEVIYLTTLKIGSYSAQLRNEIESKASNIVDFSIKKNIKNKYETNNEPLYHHSNNDRYYFEANTRKLMNYLVLKGVVTDREKLEKILKDVFPRKTMRMMSLSDIDYKVVDRGIINDNGTFSVGKLNDENEYSIITTDGYMYSKPKVMTTKNINSINLLKEFVEYNSGILINNAKDLKKLLDTINYNSYKNMISNVLTLKPSKEKDELIYLSTILQNILIRAFNHDILFNVSKNKDKPFFNSTVHNIVNSTVFTENKNGNEYFIKAENDIYNNTYDGKYNTKYSTYDISTNGIKSTKYDFVCFSPEQEYNLSKYKNINRLKDIDIDEIIKTKYKKLVGDEIIYANAKSYMENKGETLEAPYAIYDYYKNNMIVDVDYTEYVGGEYENYYLVIKDINGCLDETPAIKVKFSNKNKKVALNEINGFICRNNIYMIWIENLNKIRISNPSIVSTEEVKNQWISYIEEVDINTYTKKLMDKISFREKEIIRFIPANNKNISKKNLKRIILHELYLSLEKDQSMLDNIYEVSNILLDNMNEMELIESVIYREKKNSLYIDVGENIMNKTSIIKIDITNSDININSINANKEILLSEEGISIIYALNNNCRSKIILINNKKKEFVSSITVREV